MSRYLLWVKCQHHDNFALDVVHYGGGDKGVDWELCFARLKRNELCWGKRKGKLNAGPNFGNFVL